MHRQISSRMARANGSGCHATRLRLGPASRPFLSWFVCLSRRCFLSVSRNLDPALRRPGQTSRSRCLGADCKVTDTCACARAAAASASASSVSAAPPPVPARWDTSSRFLAVDEYLAVMSPPAASLATYNSPGQCSEQGQHLSRSISPQPTPFPLEPWQYKDTQATDARRLAGLAISLQRLRPRRDDSDLFATHLLHAKRGGQRTRLMSRETARSPSSPSNLPKQPAQPNIRGNHWLLADAHFKIRLEGNEPWTKTSSAVAVCM